MLIVKKMPILQGFPDFETVKNLSGNNTCDVNFSPLFYDIETTGLGRNSSFLYLIGAICYEDDSWQLYQWLSPDFRDEKALLEVFSEFIKNFTCTIQYNGDSFDQSYLQARCQFHELSDPFQGIPSFDLYKVLRPLKGFLKLPGLKQEQMETFLGEHKRVYCNGGECIKIYKKYVAHRNQTDLDTIVGHNMEDLLGLGDVFRMMGYLRLRDGDFDVNGTDSDGENLILQMKLHYPLPAPFSNNIQEFYIIGQDHLVSLLVKPVNGRIRQYYSNYKDYDYLPGEDMAVPKSISKFMEKGLKKSSTRDTCYTWFPCSEEFLENTEKQKQYLVHTMEYLFWKLNQHRS
ncbi:MAG: ribonuclease H-like domain-containing protein [Clostridia bacterium]|nr:ribonuclease H-like domain-containing protein [Clostridia bacterium]